MNSIIKFNYFLRLTVILKLLLFSFILFFFSCKEKNVKVIDNTPPNYKDWIGIYAFTSTHNDLDYKYESHYRLIINKNFSVIFIDDTHNLEYSGKIIDDKLNILNIELNVQNKKENIQLILTEYGFDIPFKVGDKSVLSYVYSGHANIVFPYDFYRKRLPLNDIYKFKKENTGRANSKNGLVLRAKPDLKSDKIDIIEYNEPINILTSTKVFDTITLSSNEEVIGEWKHVFYKNKEGKTKDGYSFDRFITYDIEAPFSATNKIVNIYNEKQFFDNLKDNTTLNIKKKLNLAKYVDNNLGGRLIKENASELTLHDTFDYHTQNHFLVNDRIEKIFMHDCRNLYITSDHSIEITTYPLIIKHFYNVSFNNIVFKILGKTKYDDEFRIYKSSNISFSNINFLKDQGVSIEAKSKQISFKYCSFDNGSFVSVYNSNAILDKCKFHYNQKNQINFVPEVGHDGTKLQVINSSLTKETINISHAYYTSHEFIEKDNIYY